MPQPTAPTRLAAVYVRSDAVVIVANHQTQAGFWIAAAAVVRLPITATDAELGVAVRTMLAAGRTEVPTPSRAEFSALLKEVAALADVRTWRALERVSRLCTVEERRDLRIIPHRHGGTRGAEAGYHALAEIVACPLESDDAALGAAVRRGIELSQGPRPLHSV